MRTTNEASQKAGANELMDEFMTELSVLSDTAKAVGDLRRASIVKGLAELDGSAAELPDKVLHLMDQVEASFLIIRRKLL
jgi:hypothetical protein